MNTVLQKIVPLAVCAGLCLGMSVRPQIVQADEQPRVKVFLRDANRVLADLEYVVNDLAKEKQAWEELIFLNLEIFLFGVDQDRPIRFDTILDTEDGFRMQLCVPVENLRIFITDNLEPPGIEVEGRSSPYTLKGEVYEGIMRIIDNYACIAAQGHEDDVPEGAPSPDKSHAGLVKAGYDAAAEFTNTGDDLEQRRTSFQKFRAEYEERIQKRPDESRDAFELRQLGARQQMDQLERWFVEAARLTLGWITNEVDGVGKGEFYLEALEETDLQKSIDLLGTEPSLFHAVESPEDAVITSRLTFPLDELRKSHARQFYDQLLPVLKQRIDESEDTDEQKATRHETAELIVQMLKDGAEMGVVDTILDVQAVADGKHVLLFGIRAADGTLVSQVVEKLGVGHEELTTELNVDEQSGTTIHKITVTEVSEPLVEFFGDSSTVYVAGGEQFVWIATGEGALDSLKQAIARQAEGGAGEVDPQFYRLQAQTRALLNLYDGIADERNINLLESIRTRAAEDEEEPAAETGNVDADAWRTLYLDALAGDDDKIEAQLTKVEDHVEGEMRVETGLLRATGKAIAKFAKENLQ